MGLYLTNDTELTSIANAIRTKGGTSASLTYPGGFISAIEDISVGDMSVLDGMIYRTISQVNMPNVNTIGSYAFARCVSLTTINFPVCQSIGGYAFQYCSSLTSISFPMCKTIGVNAFNDCSALKSVSFPVCTTVVAGAFYHCPALQSVSFPKCTTIGNTAFRSCFKLESAYFMGSSFISLGLSVFSNTPMASSTYLGHFGSIYVPQSMLASYKTMKNWSIYSARLVGV